MKFHLHHRLKQDCIEIGHFQLCRLLLMNDRLYPWFILVPEKSDISEIFQLNQTERLQFVEESCYLSKRLTDIYNADKMNIASIGNRVPQLHIHHIVRYYTDPAWPGPVWGAFATTPYSAQEIEQHLTLLQTNLDLCQFTRH